MLAFCMLAACNSGKTTQHPNIVIILADDLGWGDISCHGGSIPTPNIDGLFAEGLELSSVMVMPVCSPTRAALLTGRHHSRTGIGPHVINDTGQGNFMVSEEVTLAEVFGDKGYATALIGKWHLGARVTPNDQGFQHFIGNLGAANSYLNRHHNIGHLDWYHNAQVLQEDGYTTDLIAQHAADYINGSGDRPFFLYVSFTAVHNPIQATETYLRRVPADITDERKRTYAAMDIALDDAVGNILKSLDDRGIAGETIVLFASDNGATPLGSNMPFRGGKHTVYDGGIRSPSVIRWPGRINGGHSTDQIIGIEDFFPTLLNFSGLQAAPDLVLDGRDVSATLLSGAESPRDSYFWLWHDRDALRTDRWKFIRHRTSRELYDLTRDPAESENLVTQHPEIARELEEQLDDREAAVPCYPSHVPIRLSAPAPATPGGHVIEVHVKRDATAREGPLQIVLMEMEALQLNGGTRLEYDMLVARGSTSQGYFVDVSNRPSRKAGLYGGPPFVGTEVVDQFSVVQNVYPGFPQAEGRWARRIMGLANSAPHNAKMVRLNIKGSGEAEYLLYLDNINVRRGDGSVVELYRDHMPVGTRIPRIPGYSIDMRIVTVDECKTRLLHN